MSWYMEPIGSERRSTSTEGAGDAGAMLFGAASGVLTMKGAMLAGAAVGGPFGATLAGIGWVGISAAKSLWIRNALKGTPAR
ncbi:hypothetical protein KHC28_01320 [Ancylobacter sonchi]|uniref:hypothetical protein n=1 Tax=Ancylobacter sonchi TaxID=1937790 RepID=UPI001BD5CDFB|nr:hypothetical protein [Ancylobacter sonchi]MBS7532293.1 hypothetical protein [Ancylobacter sonchi]